MGYRTQSGSIVFSAGLPGDAREPLRLPCGQCVGCKLERARGWAVRCMHEASCHRENAFLTLTYDEDHVPADYSLEKRAFPEFVAKLRRSGVRCRYFYCGEYGEHTFRPHYHALLFGYSFPDKRRWSERSGHEVWKSELLDDLWGKGRCEIGTLNFESASYVARYSIKLKHFEYAGTREDYLVEKERKFVLRKSSFVCLSNPVSVMGGLSSSRETYTRRIKCVCAVRELDPLGIMTSSWRGKLQSRCFFCSESVRRR